MNKKKIIAIVLFLFVSLLMFTFANSNKSEDDFDDSKDKDTEEKTEDSKDDNNVIQTPVVNEIDNAPIIYVNPKDVKILEGTNYNVYTGVTVTDDKDNNLVPNASITNTTTLESNKTYTITYRVTDKGGNTATNTRFIKVLSLEGDEDEDGFTNEEEDEDNKNWDDEADFPVLGDPTFELISNILILQNDSYTDVKPKAYDTFNKEIEVISKDFEIDTSIIRANTITYEAIDRSGNKITATRTVQVLDPNADYDGDKFTNKEERDNDKKFDDESDYPILGIPSFEDFNDNILILQNDSYTDVKPKAYDTFNKEIEVISKDFEIDTSIIRANTITYEAIDRSGNEITATRTVEVLDLSIDYDGDGFTNEEERDNDTDFNDDENYPALEDPTFEDFDNDIEINQFASYTDVKPKAYDTIGKELLVSVSGSVNPNILGEYDIQYTAEDRKGNETTVIRTVRVVDNQNPVVTLIGNPTITINREYFIPLKFWEAGYIVNFTDPGYSVVEANSYTETKTIKYTAPYATTDTTVTSINPEVGKYTITYKLTDGSGNFGTATRIVYVIGVIDEIQDVQISVGKTEFNVCTEEEEPCTELSLSDYQVVAKDWFDGKWFDYTVINDVVIENNANIRAVGTYNVKFIATDWRGQKIPVTKTIKIVDKIDPTISLSSTEQIQVVIKGINVSIPKAVVGDNYDSESNLTISYKFKGSYEFKGNILSAYTNVYLTKIDYKVTDRSGNSSTYTYTLPTKYYLKKVNGWENLGIISSWEE